MKIAVYDNLPPGGALRYMREVVTRCAAHHEVIEFRPAYDERDWALRPLTNAVSVAKEERRLAQLIDDAAPDVVFVHGCRVMQAPGVLSMVQAPTLYMLQEPRRRTVEAGYRPGAKQRTGVAAAAWNVGRAGYDAVIGRRDRVSVAAATALACNSRFSAENIKAAYGRDASICYAGVDTDLFCPSDDASSARTYFLSVGALDATKGHDLAIEAIARLDESDRLPLTIIGSRSDPATSTSLEELAARRGVRLLVRSAVSDDALVDAYRNAAVTLCMAPREPFGLTVHESVASGTPVVAVRDGGFRETVVEDVTGATAEPSPGAIAAAIGRVRGSGLSNDPRALHAAAKPWSWDATYDQLDALLRTTAERGS